MHQSLRDIAQRTGAVVDCDALRFAIVEQARAFIQDAMPLAEVEAAVLDLSGEFVIVRLTLAANLNLRDVVGRLATAPDPETPWDYYP